MNKRLCSAIAVTFVLTFFSTGFAESEYKKMVEEADLTYSKAVSVMNSMIDQIHGLYSHQPEFLRQFDKSQEAWEQYRISHTRALFPGGRESYGSSFDYCASLESLQLVKARIRLIDQWIVGTIEGDVCGGTVRWVSVDEYEKNTGEKIPATR